MTNLLLDKDKAKQIGALAESTLMEAYSGKHFQRASVINKILEQENLKLREADLQEISGVLYKNKQGEWVILVNREDSAKRKLFTVAHELGHYFLHRDQKDEFIDGQFVNTCFVRNEGKKYQDIEVEANEFAGNLIMPKAEIQAVVGDPEEVEKVTEEQVLELAAQFKVSPHAMLTRLKNLNYGIT